MGTTTIHRFQAGEVIFKEGDDSKCMYLVNSGVISVRKKKGTGLVEIAKINEKEVIGELSFLDRLPRSATAVAVAPCELLEIPFDSIDADYAKLPDYIRKIISAVAARLRAADEIIRQFKSPSFDGGKEPVR